MATLLRAAPNRRGESRPFLTKIIRQDSVTAFGKTYLYDMTPLAFESFDDLVTIVSALASEPDYAICVGDPITPGERQRRLLHRTPEGDVPTIREPGMVNWIMIDVDKLPAPRLDMTMRERLDYIVSTLPEPFHNATYLYKWSSSAGRDGWSLLSCHLWFWLAEPQALSNLHDRASRGGDWYGTLDPAVFRPAQVLYTAAPVYDGVDDPLGSERLGVIQMAHAAAPVERWVKPYQPRAVYTSRQLEARAPGAQLQERLEEIGNPHVHQPIRDAIAHHIAVTPRAMWREEWLREEIWQRAFACARDYLKDRGEFDRYFRRLWDSAAARYWCER